jgi:hypothetical protein
MREAADHSHIQVVTMPKKGDYDDLQAWQRRTRQTIATAYASGGLCMVPWDVYMPHDAPRYFGTPGQYADLFGLVRAAADYLNGYEDAAVAGPSLRDDRFGETPPAAATGGSGQVWAFVRAKPGQGDAPVVIHLVEWGDNPMPFTLTLDPAFFFGDRAPAVRLLVPPQYDRSTHEKADATRDYASLSRTVDLPVTERSGNVTVDLPALAPWGIVIASAGD